MGYYNNRDLLDIVEDTPREVEVNDYLYKQKYEDHDDRNINTQKANDYLQKYLFFIDKTHLSAEPISVFKNAYLSKLKT